jgi:CheY-like chemotaxis protein
VVHVVNGADAVEQVKKDDFDLVLMDIQMPVMNGLEATQFIREWESQLKRNRLPILALSAHALEEDVKKSLAAGCDDHLTKPIGKKILQESISLFTSTFTVRGTT